MVVGSCAGASLTLIGNVTALSVALRSVVYESAPLFVGNDTLLMAAEDSGALHSNTATVTLLVTSPNGTASEIVR